MKQFLFMYPIDDYFDFEVKNHSYGFSYTTKDKEHLKKIDKIIKSKKNREQKKKEILELDKEAFGVIYKHKLNYCIDRRYRENNFHINWALFSDLQISNFIEVKTFDSLIDVGITFTDHISRKEYPLESSIFNKIGFTQELIVGGFHRWDCVKRIAKYAHQKGIKTLVDEDLTEFFGRKIQEEHFIAESYRPRYNCLAGKKSNINF